MVGAGLALGFPDHELDEGKKMHVHQNFQQKYHPKKYHPSTEG